MAGNPEGRRLCADQPDGIPHLVDRPRAQRCDQHRAQRHRWSDANLYRVIHLDYLAPRRLNRGYVQGSLSEVDPRRAHIPDYPRRHPRPLRTPGPMTGEVRCSATRSWVGLATIRCAE